MKDLLLVVDMQYGFLRPNVRHIIPNVIKLIKGFNSEGVEVAFTRFINHPNSAYVKWIGWGKLMPDSHDIEIVEELTPYLNGNIFDKQYYTPFIPEFEKYLEEKEINRIFVCGVATDSCVFKSAIDAFENEIEPLVVEDACFSHAGEEVHKAGLILISRNIGSKQIIKLEEALRRIKRTQ